MASALVVFVIQIIAGIGGVSLLARHCMSTVPET